VTKQKQKRSSDHVSGKTKSSVGYGSCDDNIIPHLVALNSSNTAAAHELRGGTASYHAFAKEWISLFLHEAMVSMQSKLDTLNKELDQLSAKIESSSDAVKAAAKPKLQALGPSGQVGPGRPVEQAVG